MSTAVVHPAAIAPVNLLPASRRMAITRRTRTRLWAGALSVYAVAVAAVWAWCGFGGWISALRHGPEAAPLKAREQLASVESEIEKAQAARKDVGQALVAARRRLDAAKAVGHHADWSVLLRVLGDLGAPPNPSIVLERVELRPRNEADLRPAPGAKPPLPGVKPAARAESDLPDPLGYKLEIEGLAASQVGVVRYARSLEDLRLFESVAILGTRPYDSTAPDAAGLHLFSFQIACTLTDAAAAAHAPPNPSSKGGAP